MGFHSLGLIDPLTRAVETSGYTEPTPIQSLAIPHALSGNDIIGLAQTGTGKTAAFVIPMLQRLAESNDHRNIRALVLTPTRELAQQVKDAITKYGRFMKIRSTAVYGGVGMHNQLAILRRGVDIVVATPGRLLDHMERGSINLSSAEIVVLDEADRMLDMGFIDDVKKILSTTPEKKQTLLFSATMSGEIKDLVNRFLTNPRQVEAGERRTPAENITQYFYSAEPHEKMSLLIHVLSTEKMESTLVFSRTKHGADKITRQLERKGIRATAIHSDRSQSQRERALDGFKQGRFSVLVATDIAARGIDVDGISHVINYDTPAFAEDYVHRIGRTGRAKAIGDALTFVSREEYINFRKIERFIGKRFGLKKYPEFTMPVSTESRNSQPSTSESAPANNKHDRGARRPAFQGDSRQSDRPRDHKRGPMKKRRHSGPPTFLQEPRRKSKQPEKMETFSMGHSYVNDDSGFNSSSRGFDWKGLMTENENGRKKKRRFKSR